jgi:hypothetical protein
VDAYRAAAPGSPELALALNSYADALVADSPDNPSPEVLPLLREALQLRLKTLGRNNAETAVTYARLGKVEGLPVFSGRDPARIAAAADKIRTAIRLLPDTPNADPGDLQDARLQLALVYARNGDTTGAFKASGDFLASNPSFGAYQLRQWRRCSKKLATRRPAGACARPYGIPDESDNEDEDASPPTIKTPEE